MTDGMHQVGFSQTDAAVDKQRVVDGSRGFRHRQGRSVGKIVVFSYHEGIEGVLRIEIGILYFFTVYDRFPLNQEIFLPGIFLFGFIRCDEINLAGNSGDLFNGNLKKKAVFLPDIPEKLIVRNENQERVLPK